jgi:hypothetical protein
MKAAPIVTGGDVIKLINMPLGPIWRDRALLFLEAEDKANNHRRSSLSKKFGLGR